MYLLLFSFLCVSWHSSFFCVCLSRCLCLSIFLCGASWQSFPGDLGSRSSSCPWTCGPPGLCEARFGTTPPSVEFEHTPPSTTIMLDYCIVGSFWIYFSGMPRALYHVPPRQTFLKVSVDGTICQTPRCRLTATTLETRRAVTFELV